MEETRNASPYFNGEDRISSLFSDDKTYSFVMFVDMVFIFRCKDIDIQRLCVHWENAAFHDSVAVHVNRWCLHAVEYNVEDLSLLISQRHNSAYEIPHRLMSCKSLKKLEIGMFGRGRYADIILPSSMSLPQLKVMYLNGLSISNAELSKKLFSSCPVLETLAICDCNIQTDNQRSLTVDSVSLKKFEYSHFHRHLLTHTMANIIKLSAPNLEEFSCRSFLTQYFYLRNCSPIPRVDFDMFLEEDVNPETYSKLPKTETAVYAKRMVKFLGAVCMVKEMRLSSGFLEVLSHAPDLLDSKPPRLCNLYHLILEMWYTRGCLRAIAYLLKMSPNITELFLESKKSNLAGVGDDWEAGLSSPGMLSHLNFVQMEDVEGCDAEFKLLSFLLKKAKVLEEVVVFFRSSIGSPDRVRQVALFMDKLKAVPAASSSIKMVFKS
ncbi:hypothetical protein MKW98_020598 [Papaver atlanticum]|uniref:FBD domain-containing protein n=1 Tax=Papaver atlanticum TaxID=357466 RepID=A0AAD4TIE7_9MAGN|nr:hypothetical protein MKW98_020598 [Papaver atlanticum]